MDWASPRSCGWDIYFSYIPESFIFHRHHVSLCKCIALWIRLIYFQRPGNQLLVSLCGLSKLTSAGTFIQKLTVMFQGLSFIKSDRFIFTFDICRSIFTMPSPLYFSPFCIDSFSPLCQRHRPLIVRYKIRFLNYDNYKNEFQKLYVLMSCFFVVSITVANKHTFIFIFKICLYRKKYIYFLCRCPSANLLLHTVLRCHGTGTSQLKIMRKLNHSLCQVRSKRHHNDTHVPCSLQSPHYKWIGMITSIWEMVTRYV